MTTRFQPDVLPRTRTQARPTRLGVVSFLNTLPLIDGLDVTDDLALEPFVPSSLIDRLLARDVDVALCSSIDYQRADDPLVILPAGMLGCDGPTLTVRLYASRPIEALTRVHADVDSHTSVVLLRVLLREQYRIDPEIVPYDARAERGRPEWPEAVLLIGDKVVTDSPPAVRYPHQLDLGAAWRELTGLPFVFALWLARADESTSKLDAVAAILDRQRRKNARQLESIVHRAEASWGWPKDLALRYVTHHLRYAWSERAAEGVRCFYERCHLHGFLPRVRPLRFLEAGPDVS